MRAVESAAVLERFPFLAKDGYRDGFAKVTYSEALAR